MTERHLYGRTSFAAKYGFLARTLLSFHKAVVILKFLLLARFNFNQYINETSQLICLYHFIKS